MAEPNTSRSPGLGKETVPTLRLSLAAAARSSVGELVNLTRDHRVLLTRNGRAVVVVDEGERLDEALDVVEYAAELIRRVLAGRAQGGPDAESIDAVCEELGIDVEMVRRRSAARMDG